MAVLSDRDILKAMEAKRLRIGGFKPESLTPNGYDLAIAEVAILTAKEESVREGTAKVPPQTRFAVSTVEVVDLGPDITAQLWLRTTWARKGVLASFGKVDAGFRGTLTVAALNANSSETLDVKIGERFAQIVFEDLSTPAEKAYAERSGHYQDQHGVRIVAPGTPRVGKSEAIDRMNEALEAAKKARDTGQEVTDLRRILKNARAAFESGDWDEAVRLSEQILEQLR